MERLKALFSHKQERKEVVEIVPVARVVPFYLEFIPRVRFNIAGFFQTPLFRIVMCQKQDIGPSANQLVFPGGKLNPKEIEKERKEGRGFIAAAARETYEEIGISPVGLEELGERVYSFLYSSSSSYHSVLHTVQRREGPRSRRGSQERFYTGVLPTLPFLISQPEANISNILTLSPAELEMLAGGEEYNGMRILDSLRVRNLEVSGQRELRMDEAAISTTQRIMKEIPRRFWEEEFEIKASIGKKFLDILKRRYGEKLGEEKINSIRDRIFKKRLEELSNEAKREEEKRGMLSNIDDRLNGALEWLRKKFSISPEDISDMLYDAYLAVFIEHNLEVFRRGGQEALGFGKLMEMLAEEEGEEYGRVLFLVKEGMINTEDPVLKDFFELLTAYEGEKPSTAGKRWSEMGKVWQSRFGKKLSFQDAIRMAVEFYNEYLEPTWEKLSGVKVNGLSVNKKYLGFTIADTLESIEEKDVQALRLFIIAATYAKMKASFEEAGLTQAPLIASFVREYHENREDWREVEYEVEYENLSFFPIRQKEIVISAGEKNPRSLLRKLMERGIPVLKAPVEIRDAHRAAIVMEGVDFVKEVSEFMEFLVDRLKEEGFEVYIDGVDVSGCEQEWEQIVEALGGYKEEDKAGEAEEDRIKIMGASKVKSPASNPSFRWVKFAVCYKDEEGVYSMEFQIFPGKDEFLKKKEDDPYYIYRRMYTPRENAQALLRMVFPDETYMELLKYSHIVLEGD